MIGALDAVAVGGVALFFSLESVCRRSARVQRLLDATMGAAFLAFALRLVTAS